MKISLQKITKNFKLKTALNNITVDFEEGKIHGLLGENGAGKSTLAKIISGEIRPSSGDILIDGEKIDFSRPADSLKRGIVIVNQRPVISNYLTADENVMLFARKKNGFFFPLWAPKDLRLLKKQWAPGLKLRTYVKDMGGNNRFYVSLLTALMHQPKFLILDEPSAFLDLDERKTLYKNLGELAEKGVGILVITHSFSEANKYCHNITILKEGELQSTYVNDGSKKVDDFLSKDSFSAATETEEKFPAPATKKSPCLVLEKVSNRPKDKPALLDASIVANYGEITAVSGIKEAAIGTLEDLVSGINCSYAKGYLSFYKNEKDFTKINLGLKKLKTSFLRRQGCAIVPSDKIFRASNPDLTVEEMLGSYCPIHRQKENAMNLIQKAQVNIQPEEKCRNLSGGMLQRLVLERELSTDPSLIILCNPMHGLDIMSQSQLSKKIDSLAKKGKAILIIGAADFPMTLCSKVYTMESGRTKLSFDRFQDISEAKKEQDQ